ncbi:MAG: (deoxy)nucleoside triphosphate pyrophosphohydrolase [Mycobacteriales bacterium]
MEPARAAKGFGAADRLDAADRLAAAERVAVVGAALIRDGRVLASRRTQPPRLAGLWEFPGGKVEPGESDVQALVRELREELLVEVSVGARLGDDLLIGDTAVLRVYRCRLLSGEPALVDHDAHRWLAADELADVPWVPVDLPLLEELRTLLPR